MEIPANRQVAFELIDPNELLGILALVTVTVPTGIVGYPLMATLVTTLHMAAHCFGPALADGHKGLKLVRT